MAEFSDRLLRTAEALTEHLNGHQGYRMETGGARKAAVLMPLWDDGNLVRVVFTKRTDTLENHAGQISFPGGMMEDDDEDLTYTALRETFEEIGVEPEKVKIVARMDQVLTITRFLVTPFVGLLAPNVEFNPNPVEVDRLVRVPLSKVLDRTQYKPTKITWEGVKFDQTALDYHGDVIWGATGRMLLNLLDSLGDGAAIVARAARG